MKTALTRLNLDARGGLAGPMLAALLPLLLLQTGQAQGTPAGTAISNQVAMDFEIASIPQQTLSNIDVFTVQGLIDVSVDLGNTSGPANFVITLDVTIN